MKAIQSLHQIICDTAHLAAHGHMAAGLAEEVRGWYADREEDWVVVRAHEECVTGGSEHTRPRI